MTEQGTPKITAADAGTWLEGSQGWHNEYRVVDRAEEYGFKVDECDRRVLTIFRESPTRHDEQAPGWGDGYTVSEAAGEISERASNYLNDQAPDGYSFVREDGLSLSYNEEQECEDCGTEITWDGKRWNGSYRLNDGEEHKPTVPMPTA